jgi:hypothetical protein
MPASLDEEWTYWDGKATEVRRTQQQTVAKSAENWSTLLTALLGVAGTVTFVGGLATIDKLPARCAFWTKVMISVAGLLTVGAIVCFAVASGGLLLKKRKSISAWPVRDAATQGAKSALKWSNWGRLAALGAALLVLAGSAIVLWNTETGQKAQPPTVLAVTGDRAVCGALQIGTDGRLTIGGQPSSAPLTQLLTVAACR